MDILVYTKNIKETTDKINVLLHFLDGTRMSNQEAFLVCNNCSIRVKNFNESQRGNKSRIILYDDNYTKEDIYKMEYQLIDTKPVFNINGEFMGTKGETLIAPISILKWLIASENVTYINTVGKFEDEEIKLVTKDLVEAINFFGKNNGVIYCYRDNVEDGELWFKECPKAFEDEDEFYSYDTLIEFISNQE